MQHFFLLVLEVEELYGESRANKVNAFSRGL